MPSVMLEKGGNSTATVYVGGEAMTVSGSGESWYAGGEVVVVEPVSYSAHLRNKGFEGIRKRGPCGEQRGGHLHNGSADDLIQRRKYRYCRYCV